MLYTSPPGRPVHSKAISTSLGSIQPCCNCAKTIRSHFHHCLYCQVLIYTAERTVATWGDQTCQRFEATTVGFETRFSRLRVRLSNWYAIIHTGIVLKIPLYYLFFTISHNFMLHKLLYNKICTVFYILLCLQNKSIIIGRTSNWVFRRSEFRC